MYLSKEAAYPHAEYAGEAPIASQMMQGFGGPSCLFHLLRPLQIYH